MTEPQIFVRKLSKTCRVSERDAGLRASISALWRRAYRNVEAVRDVNFTIEAGEIVGFLGPHDAGKTTTLKMLAGLLYPPAGEVRVAGFVPWQRKPDYLRRISMVLGNKSQMLWDIPPRDSFRVLGEIYRVPPSELNGTLGELFDLLDMAAILAKPVRTLSLGERMKCELVAALLYQLALHAFAQRKCAHGLGKDRGHIQQVKEFAECAIQLGWRDAIDFSQDAERIPGWNIPEHLAFVAQHHTDASQVVRFPLPGDKARHANLARCRIEQASQHLERSRFARTVWPEKAHHLPRLDGEV